MFTRKKFIALSGLSLISLLVPNYLLSAEFDIPNSTDVNVLLKQASILRKQGNKFNQAKKKYEDIIELYPNEIRAYDGLRKLYYSKKKNEWKYILILKSAHLSNPNNIEIKQRLYKEFLNASVANRKVKNLINFNGRLLQKVKQEYQAILQTQPNNINLQKQYNKISNKLLWNADTTNPHQNTLLKEYKKTQFLLHKKRFKDLNTSDVTNKLNALLAKPYSIDRKQHIRELYKIVITKNRENKNYSVALNKAIDYYNNIEKEDPYFLKQIRDLAKYQNQYDSLISIENQNHTIKNTFWSGLSLFDAHIRKIEYQNSTVFPPVLSSLFQFLETTVDSPQMIFEIKTRKIKLNILKSQFVDAKTNILLQTKDMFGISNTHMIDIMNVLIAKYYAKKNDTESKNKILYIILNTDSYLDNGDLLLQSIAALNQNRDNTKSIHFENLQKTINNL